MALATPSRAAFIALMPHLGPDEDSSVVAAFVRDNWRDCLDEVAADPGFDQVRAGLIRLFRTELAGDPDVQLALSTAIAVVRGFTEELLDGDATLLLSRHPAWVGLCALELAEYDQSLEADPLKWAITLAGAGFSTLAGPAAAGRGEVLWALAEAAEEVGWSVRTRSLLEAARHTEFADPVHGVKVRLLLGLKRLEDDENADAEELLEEVAAAHDADAQTRTHARALLAEARSRAGDREGALHWLLEAQSGVDPDEEPDVAQRLAAGLDALGASVDE